MNGSASRRDGVWVALGRLFRRTRSHRLAFAVKLSRSEPQDVLLFSSVARQGELVLVAPSYGWSVPYADAGGGGGNLAHIAANVSRGESTLSTRTLELALPAPQRILVTPTDWPAASSSVSVPLRWGGGRKCVPFKFERSQAHSVGLLSPRSGEVRNGLAWLAQHIPILRERLPAEEAAGGQSAARARLAAASGADEADIQVAGVYPRVPLALVRQMALVDGGQNLRLWLYSSKGSKAVRLWTVTLGRLRSSGRTVQSLAEDKAEDGSA